MKSGKRCALGINAYVAGKQDAEKGRCYLDSAPPGSQTRLNWKDDYDDGWLDGRGDTAMEEEPMTWKEELDSFTKSEPFALACLVIFVGGCFALHPALGVMVLAGIGMAASVRD